MTENKLELINDFRQKVLAASKEATKKELFKDLLNRLYANNMETKSVIDAISSGAEVTLI